MKLTSDMIKTLTVGRFKELGGTKLKDALYWHTGDDEMSSPEDIERLSANARRYFKCKPTCTLKELHEHIYELFVTPKEWNRYEKRRLRDDWEGYFTEKGEFAPDFLDLCYGDPELTKEIYNDPKRGERCWLRIFVPKSELVEWYELCVVTTPEDDRIVGWVVMTS